MSQSDPLRTLGSTLAAIGALMAGAGAGAMAAASVGPPLQPADYHDGHARPRALAFNRDDGLLYAALSTADAVAVFDPGAAGAQALRSVARVSVCRFPDAIVPLPGG